MYSNEFENCSTSRILWLIAAINYLKSQAYQTCGFCVLCAFFRELTILFCSCLKLGSSEDDHEKERISVEEANRPPPVPKDGFTFETLIRNRDEVEHFKEFLNKKHARGKGE